MVKQKIKKQNKVTVFATVVIVFLLMACVGVAVVGYCYNGFQNWEGSVEAKRTEVVYKYQSDMIGTESLTVNNDNVAKSMSLDTAVTVARSTSDSGKELIATVTASVSPESLQDSVVWSMDQEIEQVYWESEANQCVIHCTGEFDEELTLTASVWGDSAYASASIRYVGMPASFDLVLDYDTYIKPGQTVTATIVEYDFFGNKNTQLLDTYVMSFTSPSFNVAVDFPDEGMTVGAPPVIEHQIQCSLGEATYYRIEGVTTDEYNFGVRVFSHDFQGDKISIKGLNQLCDVQWQVSRVMGGTGAFDYGDVYYYDDTPWDEIVVTCKVAGSKSGISREVTFIVANLEVSLSDDAILF